MNVSIIDNLGGVQALRREWEDLSHACPDSGPFLSWPWQDAWLQRLSAATGRSARAPSVLAMRGRGDELRAVVPLIACGRTLKFIAADCSPYLGILARADDAVSAAAAFSRWLRDASGWRQALLSSLTEEQLQPLEWAVEEAGLACQVEPDKPCYVLSLPESPTAFAQRLPKSFRKRLDYYQRRLERAYAVEYCAPSPCENPPAVEEFLRLHLLRAGDTGRRSRFARRAFADFARAALTAADGAASVALLRCEGRAVAALAGLHWGGAFYFWNSGFDPQFAPHNVGDLIQRFSIERAIAAGLRSFDFLWGAQPYKLRWGALPRETYRLYVARSAAQVMARAAARAAFAGTRRIAASALRAGRSFNNISGLRRKRKS